jgi:hypothetical protein
VRTGETGNVFGRAWRLLCRNLAIVVPGLVVGALAAVAAQLIMMAAPAPEAGGDLWWILLDVTQILAAILTISYTTGMADAAWRSGHAGFSDGRRAFRREGGHVLVAMLCLLVLGAAAAVLAPFTFELTLVAYVYFCSYTMASAVVGERPGLLAVRESAQIAFSRPLPTLVMVAGVFGIAFGLGALALGSAALPLLGPLISDLVVQAVIAYAVLVIVGEYRLLRGLSP